VIFWTLDDRSRQFIGRLKTTTGLRLTVGVLEKVYTNATRPHVRQGSCLHIQPIISANMKIVFDEHLPK